MQCGALVAWPAGTAERDEEMTTVCVEMASQVETKKRRPRARVREQRVREFRVPRVRRPATFPERYGQTYVSLMEVGACSLFAYWEATREDLARLRRELGGSGEIVLRFYDVTYIMFNGENAHTWFDITVDEGATSWYVNLCSPGRSLITDLGLRDREGNFVALARSNCVQAPHAWTGEDSRQEWIHVEGDPRKRQRVGAEQFAPGKVIRLWENRVVELQRIAPFGIMASVDRGDIEEFYSELFASAASLAGQAPRLVDGSHPLRERKAGREGSAA